MTNYLGKQKLDQIKEGVTPPVPPVAPPPQPPPQPPPAEGNAPPTSTGTKPEDFGYEANPPATDPAKAGDPPPPGDKSKETPPPAPTDIKENNTGYELDDKKVEPPPAEPPKADPPPALTELDKKLEGLPKTLVDKTKAQIERINKKDLPDDKKKELIEEVIGDRKQEFAESKAFFENAQKEQQTAVQRQRSAWRSELEKDPTFGGQNFKANVVKAQKVLDDVFPNTKKALTRDGTTLPPDVMRDMAALYDRLHKASNFVQGDPPAPPEPPPKSKLETALDFYGNQSGG